MFLKPFTNILLYYCIILLLSFTNILLSYYCYSSEYLFNVSEIFLEDNYFYLFSIKDTYTTKLSTLF